MTSSKYFLLCIASRFGYLRKTVRLGQAANEAHLLKEAETFLGEAIWGKTENIEALSMEYWNLRKLTKDFETISKEIEQFQGKFNETRQQRTEGWKITQESLQDLINERREILNRIDKLTRDRDHIIAKARDMHRSYHGLKIKEDVLRKEGDKIAEIQKTSDRLDEIRNEFEILKQSRENIAQEITSHNNRIQEIEAQIGERRNNDKSFSMVSSQSIGDANQQISSRQAQINSHNSQMRQLYSEIGRYISLNVATDRQCKEVGKNHRGLIDVMTALRRSIQYNWKLAERR